MEKKLKGQKRLNFINGHKSSLIVTLISLAKMHRDGKMGESYTRTICCLFFFLLLLFCFVLFDNQFQTTIL